MQLSPVEIQSTLAVTKALSDASRLRIIVELAVVDELCACQLTEMLGLSAATVSRHMNVLLNADLVRSRKDSRWVYYRLSDAFPALPEQRLLESLFFSREATEDRERLANGLSCHCDIPWLRQRDAADYHAGNTSLQGLQTASRQNA